jgi:hypothetical protein
MIWCSTDPAFVGAIEARYLAEARRLRATSIARDVHEAALATAIYRADPTNGGLRYRALDAAVRAELNDRLLRFEPRPKAPGASS